MTAVTLAIPAGSPPAAPKLTSERWIHQQSRYQSCRATRRSFVHTNEYDHASPQTNRGNCLTPYAECHAPWLNPHSDRAQPGLNITRFPALALFGRRPPHCVVSPSSRRPKTCTKADSWASLQDASTKVHNSRILRQVAI